MKSGALLFVLFFGAFVGFELYAAKRNSYRMEPEFIFGLHVGAARAVTACDADKSSRRQRFERNFLYARDRALAELAESASATTDVDAQLAEQITAVQTDVDALLAEHGCDHIEAWKLLKRYDMLARQNPPVPD